MGRRSLPIWILSLSATCMIGILLLVVVLIPLEWRRYETTQWIKLGDTFHARLIVEGVQTVYERVPILYSLAAYQRSAFYPFAHPVPPCEATTMSMGCETAQNMVIFRVTIVQRERRIIISSQPKNLPAAEKRTRQLFASYLSGTRWWYGLVQQVRANTHERTDYIRKIVSKWCGYSVTLRPMPVLPSYDLPRTPEEGRHYIRWLSELIGFDQLVDGWGQSVCWEIRKSYIVLCSAGADHQWDTADDVVARLRLGQN
jgi:hypothetical protein